MDELIFEVTPEADGGYCAECLTVDIFTQADTWDELRTNVREAVRAYFFDGGMPDVFGCTWFATKCSGRCEDARGVSGAGIWWQRITYFIV